MADNRTKMTDFLKAHGWIEKTEGWIDPVTGEKAIKKAAASTRQNTRLKFPHKKVRINYDQWRKHYKPIVREDGTELFETYGPDLDFINTVDNDKIWTLTIHGYIINGFQFVDRLAYLVTEVPCRVISMEFKDE